MQIDTDKTVIEARFYISGIKLVPVSDYKEVDGQKTYYTEMGGEVQMNAAKHGTFGKYTPSGNATMLIHNPHAFSVFKEAFERILKEKGRTPRFKVYFVEDDDQEPDK
jgi:hypothetical protein